MSPRSDRSPAEPSDGDAKECARCLSPKLLSEISEVRLRVGGCAVFICRSCKEVEGRAPLLLGFECPGWGYGREGYRCPRLRFLGGTPPAAESLSGEYDVVYFAADQTFGPRYHRRTRGTMTLSLVEGDAASASRGDRLLFGTVSMDRRMAVSDTPWVDRFSFLQDGATDLRFPGFEDGAYISYHGRQHQGGDRSPLRGQIRTVRERAAVRSRPDARAHARSGGRGRPVTFATAEQAEGILADFTNSISRWISVNLGLPDLAASHICGYWRSRPPPVYFFEGGDLCLTTRWPRRGYMYDDVATLLVARRRAPVDWAMGQVSSV